MNTETLEQHYYQHRAADTCVSCSEYFDRAYPQVSDHTGSTVLFAAVIALLCSMIVVAWLSNLHATRTCRAV